MGALSSFKKEREKKYGLEKMSGSVRKGCWWFGAVPEKLD